MAKKIHTAKRGDPKKAKRLHREARLKTLTMIHKPKKKRTRSPK